MPNVNHYIFSIIRGIEYCHRHMSAYQEIPAYQFHFFRIFDFFADGNLKVHKDGKLIFKWLKHADEPIVLKEWRS